MCIFFVVIFGLSAYCICFILLLEEIEEREGMRGRRLADGVGFVCRIF